MCVPLETNPHRDVGSAKFCIYFANHDVYILVSIRPKAVSQTRWEILELRRIGMKKMQLHFADFKERLSIRHDRRSIVPWVTHKFPSRYAFDNMLRPIDSWALTRDDNKNSL